MAKRKKRKLDQNESRGKGVFLALGVGGAILVVGVVLAIFAFKKDPKPPNQQAQVSDENKTSESDDNGSLLPGNTPGALTNLVVNPGTSPSINLDLPVGKRMEWTYRTGEMDIQRIYMGKTTNTLTQVFGKPDSIVNTDKFVVFKYDQMKVLEGTNRYSTVRFTLRQEAKGEAKVMAVTPDPRSVVANPLNPGAAVTTGLVAYYPFNGNANDESGNGHHGKVNGATLTTDRNGIPGKAFSFDGKNDYINVLAHRELGPGKITISLWVLPQSTKKQWILYKSELIKTGFVTKEQYCMGSASGRFKGMGFLVKRGSKGKGGAGWQYAISGMQIPLSKWHHFVGIWDGAQLKFYVDGRLHKQVSASPGDIDNIAGGDLRFGCGWKSPHSENFFGKLDDIRIFNRALTLKEVISLYSHKN